MPLISPGIVADAVPNGWGGYLTEQRIETIGKREVESAPKQRFP